jgi:NADH-quinone oxidoreductase subunit J
MKFPIGRLILFLAFYTLLITSIFTLPWPLPEKIMETSTFAIGKVIFDLQGFVVPFEILSLVLLAAMIGAVFLARGASK